MTEITKDEATARIARVLEAAGIKAEMGGDGFFDVEFPDGAICDCDYFYIKCDGIEHQRGRK